MSILDITKYKETEPVITGVHFSDENEHGTGKVHGFTKDTCLDQFTVKSRYNHDLHIKYADIDNLILALKYIQRHWSNQ